MSQLHSTTTSHKKGKPLSFEERVVIQLRIKDNYSIRAIAREIGCSPTTVPNEIKRGTVIMLHITEQNQASQDMKLTDLTLVEIMTFLKSHSL